MTQNRDGAHFTESIIQENSPLEGISLKAANIQEQTGLVVIAIQDRMERSTIIHPEIRKFDAGDALLVIANQRQLQMLHRLTGDPN